MNTPRRYVAVAAVAAALLALACSGSSDDQPGEGSPPEPTPTPALQTGDPTTGGSPVPASPEATPSAQDPSAGTPAPDNPTPEATPATPTATEVPSTPVTVDAAELARLHALLGQSDYAATFTLESPAAPGLRNTWTFARDASQDRWRYSFVGREQRIDDGFIVQSPSLSVACAATNCLGIEIAPGAPLPGHGFLAIDIVRDLGATAQGGTVTANGTRTVAATEATCFLFDNATAEGELCLSSAGVPLFADIDQQGDPIHLEVTVYRESVTEADFEPPSPPIVVPAG